MPDNKPEELRPRMSREELLDALETFLNLGRTLKSLYPLREETLKSELLLACHIKGQVRGPQTESPSTTLPSTFQTEIDILKGRYPDIADDIDAAAAPFPSSESPEIDHEPVPPGYSPGGTKEYPFQTTKPTVWLFTLPGDHSSDPYSPFRIGQQRTFHLMKFLEEVTSRMHIHQETVTTQKPKEYTREEIALIGLYASRDLMVLEALGCRADVHANEELRGDPDALDSTARDRFKSFFQAVLTYAPGENYERPPPGLEDKIARPLDPLPNLDRVQPVIKEGNLIRENYLQLRNDYRAQSCYRNAVGIKAKLLETK
ncbi:MAG: hypothetical protein QGH47_02405 [Candidatus Woesearchaeota archaeon]|nr:hypothetical protein [Candidatus Woesearchaeota archaeon]